MNRLNCNAALARPGIVRGQSIPREMTIGMARACMFRLGIFVLVNFIDDPAWLAFIFC